MFTKYSEAHFLIISTNQIISPKQTWIFIYHENVMSLLIKYEYFEIIYSNFKKSFCYFGKYDHPMFTKQKAFHEIVFGLLFVF